MDIETLQIKRVTGNWNTHKDTPTVAGEPIYIAGGLIDGYNYPILIIGEDDKTIDDIVTAGKVFIEKNTVNTLIENGISESLSTANPNAIDTDDAVGSSDKVARADHTHKITKDTVTTVLKDTNDFAYHGIKFSKSAPTNDTPGNIGDIIIVYEDK